MVALETFDRECGINFFHVSKFPPTITQAKNNRRVKGYNLMTKGLKQFYSRGGQAAGPLVLVPLISAPCGSTHQQSCLLHCIGS